MNDIQFLQIQNVELEQLLQNAADDPILAPQLRIRLDQVKRKLQSAKQSPGDLFPREASPIPRAAIFMRGGGVNGSSGIRAALAGEALLNYDRMYAEQAMHDERVAAKKEGKQRRPRGIGTPSLMFTGTPRGSFGLEFTPQFSNDTTSLKIYSEALEHVADAIEIIVNSSNDTLPENLNKIPAKVLKPLKKFLGKLSEFEAELRLAFHNKPSRILKVEDIQSASMLLDNSVAEEEISFVGINRGVTLDSGHFDFKLETGEDISGLVDENLSEDDLVKYNQFSNLRCEAKMQKITVQQKTGGASTKYILVNLALLTNEQNDEEGIVNHTDLCLPNAMPKNNVV